MLTGLHFLWGMHIQIPPEIQPCRGGIRQHGCNNHHKTVLVDPGIQEGTGFTTGLGKHILVKRKIGVAILPLRAGGVERSKYRDVRVIQGNR